MEGRRYQDRLPTRPPTQSSNDTLFEDLGSTITTGSRKKSKKTVVIDSDSEDELNSLPPSSQSQPKVPLSTEDAIKKLSFRKQPKEISADAEQKPTLKENNGRVLGESREYNNSKNSSASASTRPFGEKVANRDQHAKRTAPQRRVDEMPPRPKPRQRRRTPSPPSPSSPVAKTRATADAGRDKGQRQETRRLPQPSPPRDRKGKGKAQEEFPVLSPLRNTLESRPLATDSFPIPSPLSSPAKGTGQEFPFLSPLRNSHGATDLFPLPSPLSSPAKDVETSGSSSHRTPMNQKRSKFSTTDFPFPSPLRSLAAVDEGPKHRDISPFPMNTQDFGGASGKRRSSDSDEERDRKRYRNQSRVPNENEHELLFISPDTDPKTLCPFCDTPLPAQPTPLLTRLLEQTVKKSYRDPRPSNPLGRKAPVSVFVAVCQRHRYENETLPEAEARGWPKFIDWGELKRRVLAMKRDLAQIIADPGDPIVYGQGGEEQKEPSSSSRRSKGPRMRCLFWRDLVKDLQINGTKGIKGVQGQFTNFEKTQPGYYGEMGSVIINQTLYDMFPLAAVDPSLVDPLTPNEFIQRILVPEVGMRLVIEDMSLNVDDRADKKRAMAVLRESASYGVAMFPEDTGEGAVLSGKMQDGAQDVMGIADQMIMERALRRRKELEIEEREEEEEMLRLQQEEQEAAEKKRKKADAAKEKRRARKEKEKEEEEEPNPAPQKTVPRPRPLHKVKDKASRASSTSGMDTDSSRPTGMDSDTGMSTCGNGDASKTPKASSSLPKRVETSDSDCSVECGPVVPPKPKPSKSRAARAAATYVAQLEPYGDQSVKTSSRRRSPSVLVTDSKLATTQGSSAIDLCSSDDGSLASDAPRRPGRRKVTKPMAPPSSEEDDADATPRVKKPRLPSATSSGFMPLEAARQRKATAKGERSTEHKESTDRWTHSLAIDISDSEESDRPRSQSSDSWLLDDISFSQS